VILAFPETSMLATSYWDFVSGWTYT
jgi:hypothetical protein